MQKWNTQLRIIIPRKTTVRAKENVRRPPDRLRRPTFGHHGQMVIIFINFCTFFRQSPKNCAVLRNFASLMLR